MKPETCNDVNERIVARWETKGNDWIELIHKPSGYWYRGNTCGGGFDAVNDGDAIGIMCAGWGDPRGGGHEQYDFCLLDNATWDRCELIAPAPEGSMRRVILASYHAG